MKILITADWYEPVVNGVVTSVRTLAAQLRRRGHQVRILTLSRTCHSYLENQVYYAGSVGVGCIYPEARLKLPASGDCIRQILDWGPEIIHSQCEFSTFFLAKRIAAELQIPIVHTCHTIYEEYTHYFSPRKSWGRGLARTVTRRISGQVKAMIVPSRKVQKIMEGYGVTCPVWVIPTGIDLSRCGAKEEAGQRELIRKRYGIGPEMTVLLYVGRLAKEKNVEELLSLQQMAGKGQSVLMITGDGPCREELERQVRERNLEDQVIFTGMVPPEAVAGYYQSGDLFVTASRSETQGMTYAEALASGLPLLCRKDGCLEGVVTQRVNGWQYENSGEFLEFLTEWRGKTDEERGRMGWMAKKSAGMFSAEAFGREVEKVYEQAKRNGEIPIARWA